MAVPDKSKPAKKRGWTRRLLIAAVAALALVCALSVAIVAFLPHILPLTDFPELEFDLAPYISKDAAALVDNTKVTTNLRFSREVAGSAIKVRAKGMLLDWPYSAKARIRYGFIRRKGGIGPWVDASLSVTLDDTGWKLNTEFHGDDEWSFTAAIPENSLAHDDPVLSQVLSRLQLPITNLVFSGKFSMDAEGECTKSLPVPAWNVRASITDIDASFETSPGDTVAIQRFRTRFGVDGIADHVDIAPMFPRADSISAAGLVLSNVFASIRATERAYLVTEAGADCCGGELRLFSVFLDPERLSAGATVFVDGIDAGEVLSRISGFRGEASGKLHGKLPFFLKDGERLYLHDAYLFSKPGATGKVRITDAEPILNNLELAGISKEERDNLANALADLDYNVLKLELKQGIEGETSSLPLLIQGTATRGSTTVPVTLNVNFHGDFDYLINTGMKISRRGK